ncbi:hypothetical protein DFH06DRAFT_1312196 [Mycena polygramma]|nr:hypothetical protein DFH06DRAFT_1312196 [Mycena polygramma]
MPDICWKCGAASPALASLLEPFSLPGKVSPEIDHLLKTNDVPLDSQIPAIREIISERIDALDTMIGALDVQIRHLQATRAQLARRRSETADCAHQFCAIPSPVRRVPQELISEIFALLTAQDRARLGSKPPWRLGFICRSWRRYAFSYSLLWSSLTISTDRQWHPHTTTRMLSKLQAQLLRSATGPLDISWSGVSDDPETQVLDLVLPDSNHWRTVRFDISGSKPVLDWLQPVYGKLDRLERLEVINAARTIFPDIFAAAPKLREVAFFSRRHISGHKPAFDAHITIPWGQITHYRGELSFARQLDILFAAPNLSSCALDIVEPHNFVPPIDTPVLLAHLRRLCVDRVGSLLNITAPKLEELCSVYSVHMIPRIVPFIRRASCTLQRMCLWQCPLSSELITALRALPTLTYLLLENDHHREPDGVDFFTAMAVSGTASDICPHLTAMVYGYEYWESAGSQDSFVTMARSRFRPTPSGPSDSFSLRVLVAASYLDGYAPPAPGMKARLQILQDEGLDVAFLDEQDTTEHLLRRYI